MDSNLLNLILSNTFTPAQALNKLHQLKKKAVAVFFQVSPKPDPILPQYINRDNVYQVFEAAEKEIKAIPALVIYLPIELPSEQLIILGNYVRKFFNNDHFLIEVKLDPTLLAGPAFVWQGIYKDYSIRQKLLENHQAILEIIKSQAPITKNNW